MPIFFISLIFAVLLGLFIYLLSSEEPSRIQKRIKRTQKKPITIVNKFFANITEIISPLSKKNLSNKKGKDNIKTLLMQAGMESLDDSILAFESKRIFYTLICGAVCLIFVLLFRFNLFVLGIAVIVLYAAYSAPTMILKVKISKRQKDLIKNLPDAIDLLAICLQAGLGLDAALARIETSFR